MRGGESVALGGEEEVEEAGLRVGGEMDHEVAEEVGEEFFFLLLLLLLLVLGF